LQLFKEGDPVRARVLSVDVEKRRVNFSLKPAYFADENVVHDGDAEDVDSIAGDEDEEMASADEDEAAAEDDDDAEPENDVSDEDADEDVDFVVAFCQSLS